MIPVDYNNKLKPEPIKDSTGRDSLSEKIIVEYGLEDWQLIFKVASANSNSQKAGQGKSSLQRQCFWVAVKSMV